MRRTTRLRKLVEGDGIHVAPGAFDGLTARLVEEAGFDLIYASGGAIARSAGFPDIGLLSFTEVCSRLEQMVAVTHAPIIADADTGFGNAANARRTVQVFERLGVAGMHIEDQSFPKRCGHLDDKSLVSTDEMVHKIGVVKEAQRDPDFVLIARTDAIATEGLDAALDRSHAYLSAGADVIFVEAPESVEQIRIIAREIPQPKLINMFHSGKTPIVPTDELRSLGYRLVIIPSDLQRAAITGCQRVLQAIRRDGNSVTFADDMVSFADRESIVGTAEYLSL
ncbi:Isocitrate lyase family protein [Mycobacteroides abscessus subsp. bolletii]|uniref:isocitrate lyase/PEP mutase family protein n=1 Tax=Mycobacteroides abscessus TaxID=36809 RepID=UPI0005B4977E|nr:isocitrate lyase/phosphoenolpyruvate mutase family protein [Mycobacteroides abscessus]SHX71310.1 Isocitrate lyase family protein [Mycobacteroides abscessus subsp. bolletii]SKP49230.1 Isocitrate lyase family protein [Mycobacteroides abscessus subsp. bolletii]SKP86712.1 Isocitrate lyase family protein [Mycobacteroides abscessus subsp. bolletii]SKQ10582.1 Isocitrate lyase family protein [Mycobacteroides abscessus subsp. bolletii]